MRFALLSLLSLPFTTAFDYGVSEAGGLQLDDVETGISEIKTIFKDRKFHLSSSHFMSERASCNL